MPEEKKENKAAKKDSFTFSDKIKNSKPAASKSFANRISSKIGSDGKPKKTLFERTKRDAPFFIAAIVALLLLPFLYKYSGSIDEEPTMITPATEDTPFDPNRSGFDGIGDPEGQIAQLSGRDPMSLIIGFGDKKEEVSDELPFRNDLERSGLDEDYSSSNNTSKEYNERNVYKYKKQAAPATKAAFKKTNINPLRGAGLTSRSGGKLSVGMWGGSMKKAADKVKGDAPKSSPKPVSLQPLQAAGKPSRSYFGQGAAAEARRSKDAMSKANAMQALMDAQMKPIEPGKIGGIGGGDFGGPGGGNGNLERKFAFNGKEPWWWDMMKQRSQMEWEAKFNRKWDWIKWGDKLAQTILGGILNCLITGDEDGAPGKLFGAKAGAGEADECQGLNEKEWNRVHSDIPFSKDFCREYYARQGVDIKKNDPWKAGKGSAVDLNFFQVRWDCLSNGAFDARKKRKAHEGLAETNDCNSFYKDGHYYASVSGDYSVFHYVVGVPSDKWDSYIKTDDAGRKAMLHVAYVGKGNSFSVNPEITDQLINKKNFIPLFIESAAVKNKKVRKESGAIASVLDTNSEMAALISENPDGQYDSKTNKSYSSVALTYETLLSKLSNGGFRIGNQDNNNPSVLISAKGGKKGKDWRTGARCAYPLAFVSCHDTANAKVQLGELDTAGNPAAYLSFPNVAGVSGAHKNIQKMFRVVYRVEDRLNTQNTTPLGYFVQTINNSDDYVDPEVQAKDGKRTIAKKYNVAASGKGAEAIKAAAGLSSNDKGKQSSDYTKSAAVTWEIRQCWNPLVPWSFGRFIADGACGRSWGTNGVNAKDLPGIVVSSATCVYGDEGELSVTSNPVSTPADECVVNDRWKNDKVCCEKYSEEHPSENLEWDGKQCVAKSAEAAGGAGGSIVTVTLAPQFGKIPQNFTDRSPNDGFGAAKYNSTQTSNCSVIDGAALKSASAQAFVTQVVTAYNENHGNEEKMIDPVTDLIAPQFIDALNVAQGLTITKVPARAVCALTRQISANSQDQKVGTVEGGNPMKTYPNPFGAWLDYVTPDASYWPGTHYYDDAGNKRCDPRFLSWSIKGDSSSGFSSCTMKTGVNPIYHYGDYNYNGKSQMKPSFGAAADYPLAEMALSKFKRQNPGKDATNRALFENLYNQMVRSEDDCAILPEEQMMTITNVLRYVDKVCTNGLSTKPFHKKSVQDGGNTPVVYDPHGGATTNPKE